MLKEEILNELSEAILHNSLIRAQIIETKCAEYLKECGYKVVAPVLVTYKNIKNVNELVRFFYVLVDYHYPSPMGYYRNISKDRAIAKRFVENRVEASQISKEDAIKECAFMIESLFKYADEFKFKNNPTSFGIFGQESMGWVTEKLVHIILKKKEEAKEARREQLEKEMLDKILEEKGAEYLRLEGI